MSGLAGKVINSPDLSFDSQDDSLRYLDAYGHGTHLAGIIAARDPNVPAGDLVLLTALVLRIDTAPPAALPALTLAALASVARMAASAWCARHCRTAWGQLQAA